MYTFIHIAVRITIEKDRDYLITPGKTTPDMFMKEYGLAGVLFCNGEEMDLDVPMLELGTDAKQAKFKLEREQSKCISIEWILYSLISVRVFRSDGAPHSIFDQSVSKEKVLSMLGSGRLSNCHGSIVETEVLTLNNAPYLFAPQGQRGFASLGSVLAPMIPSIRL